MSTPESLTEDVRYLLKKLSFLDGEDFKSLCRDLGLPVLNMASSDMAEQVRDKVYAALDSYSKMPSRESERILVLFRNNMLLKNKFLERYLEKVKKSTLG